MELVASLKSKSIPDIVEPVFGAFIGILIPKKAEIDSIKKETFQFGKTDRHKLDVYYPPESQAKGPIVFFSYGGALQQGDRVIPGTMDLVYNNMGAFFAKQGYLTVIADYRLSVVDDPNGAKFPECSEDVNDALKFLASSSEIEKVADTKKIFLLGHSAGGMIQSQLVLHPTLISDDLRSRIKGAIWNGTPYHFDTNPPAMPFENYFGAETKANCPLGLLKSASDSQVARLPPLLIIYAEREPDEIIQTNLDFIKVLKERKAPQVTEYQNPVHNHISSCLALSAGEGDQWGYDVVQWIQGHQ